MKVAKLIDPIKSSLKDCCNPLVEAWKRKDLEAEVIVAAAIAGISVFGYFSLAEAYSKPQVQLPPSAPIACSSATTAPAP